MEFEDVFVLTVYPVTMNFYLVLDELLLPHMKKIDSMLNDNRKRLLVNLHLDQSFKVFPSDEFIGKLSGNHSLKCNRKEYL